MPRKRLRRTFFRRNTHAVAKELLGKILVRNHHGALSMGRIVETESYVGEDDAACHASRGRTVRTEIMFGEAGLAYVYLIYGMYHCLNIVTEKKDFPAAVLIRALEPVIGIPDTTNGPGKLCRALHITRALNGEDMTTSQELYVIDDGYAVRKKDIAMSARIGVDYAGADAKLPWRYYLKNSAFVSHSK